MHRLFTRWLSAMFFYLEAKQRLKGKKSGFFRVNREIKSSRIKAGI